MKKTLLAAAIVLLLTAGSFAETRLPGQEGVPQPGQAGQDTGRVGRDGGNPCKDDIAKLCPNVIPGGGRIIMCLRSRYDKVSPECRAWIDEGQKRVADARKSCENDIAKYCKDVKPGDGRVVMCLKQNIEVLEPDCRRTVEEAGKNVKPGKKRGNKPSP